MEAFLLLAGVVAILWLLLSDKFRTHMQDPRTLRDGEVEDAIIELKKKILLTREHSSQSEYERQYYRLRALMGRILERHQHFVLDVEAKGLPHVGFFKPREHHDLSGLAYTEYALPYDLYLPSVQPSVLLYACFFLWHGGVAKDVGKIESDATLMMRILDYLIEEHAYGPALFFKGMVLKYGAKVYDPSQPISAKALLDRARQAGVGSAAIELAQIGKYEQLQSLEAAHP